jgi:hypothetical protein
MTTPEAPDAGELDDADLAAAIDPPPGPYEILPKRIKLDTPLAIRRAMVRVFADMRAGRVSGVEGGRQIRALDAIARANAALDTDRRLARIEQMLEGQRRSTRR